jgi:hypothetical protein
VDDRLQQFAEVRSERARQQYLVRNYANSRARLARRREDVWSLLNVRVDVRRAPSARDAWNTGRRRGSLIRGRMTTKSHEAMLEAPCTPPARDGGARAYGGNRKRLTAPRSSCALTRV